MSLFGKYNIFFLQIGSTPIKIYQQLVNNLHTSSKKKKKKKKKKNKNKNKNTNKNNKNKNNKNKKNKNLLSRHNTG